MRLSVRGVSKAVWFLTASRLIPAMLCDTPCEDPLEGLECWRMSPLSDQLETMQSLAFDCQGPLISKRQQIGLNLCCAFAGVVGAITHCDPKSCARSSLSHVNSCQSMMQWQEGSNQHHPCWDIWRWRGYWSKRFRYLVFFFGGGQTSIHQLFGCSVHPGFDPCPKVWVSQLGLMLGLVPWLYSGGRIREMKGMFRIGGRWFLSITESLISVCQFYIDSWDVLGSDNLMMTPLPCRSLSEPKTSEDWMFWTPAKAVCHVSMPDIVATNDK